jgi:hypothetical protein
MSLFYVLLFLLIFLIKECTSKYCFQPEHHETHFNSFKEVWMAASTGSAAAALWAGMGTPTRIPLRRPILKFAAAIQNETKRHGKTLVRLKRDPEWKQPALL